MKKKKVRLTDEKARFLGIEPRANQPGRNSTVYYITPEQHQRVREQFNDPTKVENKNTTSSNNYKKKGRIMSALDKQGRVMNIDKYCEFYNLPRNDIKSYKLVSHTGVPFYNIVFTEQIEESDLDWDALRGVIQQEISRTYIYKPKKSILQKEGVLKWADLHFGAFIRNLLVTPDFDKDILRDGLMRSAEQINILGYKKVHVHIHGDLIESFSGLNHINSWQSMDPEAIGPQAVKMCCTLLDSVFQRINNLGTIKIVAGNHDRTSKANDEDVKGGAADLIAWGLELMGYDVEFHSYVLTHKVEGINYIILHGDKAVSKRSTKEILWRYGVQDMFNLICEGHLHTNAERLSVNQREKFEIVKDDAIDHRRILLPSFFTGNYYSETLSFSSNAGYLIVHDNGKGKPEIFNGAT